MPSTQRSQPVLRVRRLIRPLLPSKACSEASSQVTDMSALVTQFKTRSQRPTSAVPRIVSYTCAVSTDGDARARALQMTEAQSHMTWRHVLVWLKHLATPLAVTGNEQDRQGRCTSRGVCAVLPQDAWNRSRVRSAALHRSLRCSRAWRGI